MYTAQNQVHLSEFLEEISDALQKVKTLESTISLGVFTAHVRNGAGVWRRVAYRLVSRDTNY